jgi:cellobiose-specific phosphotransferase system component IIA
MQWLQAQKARIDALLPQLHEAEERLHRAVEEHRSLRQQRRDAQRTLVAIRLIDASDALTFFVRA